MLSYIISENHPLASRMTVAPMIFHSPRHVYMGGQEMLPTHVMFDSTAKTLPLDRKAERFVSIVLAPLRLSL
jgi:hypothetical protein